MQETILALITVLTPVVIAATKKMVPALRDRYSHLIPVLAPIIGAVSMIALNYSGAVVASGPWGPVIGALLGLAGIGLREIADQTKKSLT